MDAFTDYYGDWLMEPLLRQPRPGGADAEWRARQPQDPAVRRALDVWSDPGATRAQREWAARVLLDAGVPGVWQGGLPAEAARAAEVEWVNYGADEEWYPRRLMLSRPEETADWRPHRILDIGPGYDPEGPRLVELQEGRKLVSSLEALHNRYPNAQLGAVDVKEQVITGIREDYVCTGRLPESTKLMHYEELGYLDPRVLREYGRSDLVVCIAPPPSMIYEAGGPVGFVRSLQNLTEPGGRVYVAIDPSTLESIGRSRFEAAFWEIAGAKPAYYEGPGLYKSRFASELGLDQAYSGWISVMYGRQQVWADYYFTRR